MGRALRRIPTWAWLAAIVVGSTIVRAILGEGSRRAVHHGRRDHLVGGRPRDRGRRRAAPSRRAGSGLQHRVPAADQPGLRALREPARRVRGREDAQRAPHVARCRAGVLPRPASRARRPRVARGAHGDRDPVHGVHGHGHDGERVLPALPRRRARPRARAGAPDAAARRRASRARRPRVRDPRAGGGDRCGGPPRAARARGVRRARPRRDDLAIPLALRDRRRQRAGAFSSCRSRPGDCSAPTRRRRPVVRRRARRFATSGGTSPSSRSTSS